MDPQLINSLLPADPAPTIELLSLLVILSFLPLLMLLATPFLRMVVVLFLLRQAIGVQQTPPSSVLTGVALIMTFFALGPTFSEINEVALTPLAEKEISLGEALVRGYEPLRQNVLQRVDEDDVGFFYEMTRDPVPATTDQIDFPHLIAAHVLGELRVSFSLGFIIFIPFLVVDLIVANVLLALGMAMLSPPIISLPFKIMIFVAVDGWALIMRGLLESFL